MILRLSLVGTVVIAMTGLAEAPMIEEESITEKDRQHWSFRAIGKPAPPTTKRLDWGRNPVDAFILSKLEQSGLAPSSEANRLHLARRVHFDLTGLLPTPDQVDDFLADTRPDAYEKLVDRLLGSPHFGERWSQHWLDAVRFAESNGYEADGDRPSAWRYRDYVVRSLNENKPISRFLTEQFAGDELAKGRPVREVTELWIATGLHRCGPQHLVSGNIDPDVSRQEVLIEMVQGIGSAVLGLTVNCARCHDHKFDPISQADYYRLEAFFAPTRGKEIDFATVDERTAHLKAILDLQLAIKPIKTQIENLDAPYRQKVRDEKRLRLEPILRRALDVDPKNRTPEEQKLAKEAEPLLKVTWDEILAAMSPEHLAIRAKLRAEQHALEAELPMPPSQAWAVANDSAEPKTAILKRGDIKKKGPMVASGFPRVLVSSGMNQAPTSRLDLAQWVVSESNPLTSRVYVNRIWQHYFGTGLVATPNDFGLQGSPPSHPELLDFLATSLVRSDWRSKELHRMIVLSSTYRQASGTPASDVAKVIDPQNRLLWRMNRKRMDGESLRDNMLLASGDLNAQLEGPSVRIPLEPEVYDLIFTEGEPDGLWPVTSDVRQHTRRSLYLLGKRNVRLPLMEAFDQPDRLSPCSARTVSTFAPQSLILLNGPLTLDRAKSLATRLVAIDDSTKAVEYAYRTLFSRLPTASERITGVEFLREQAEIARERLLARQRVNLPDRLPPQIDPAQAAATVDYLLALFNLNEFAFVP